MENDINNKIIEITRQMAALAQSGDQDNAMITVLVQRLARAEVAFDRLSDTVQKVIKAIIESENARRQ